MKKFTMKVIKALCPPATYTTTYGGEWTPPAATATNGQPCQYFTAEATNAGSAGVTRTNVATISMFYYTDLQSVFNEVWISYASRGDMPPGSYPNNFVSDIRNKIEIGAQGIYTLRNQSTETMKIDAYYCKARSNMNVDAYSGGIVSIYGTMAAGFNLSGIDENLDPALNSAMVNSEFTPYNSYLFTKYYKIYKVKHIVMDPSEEKSLKIASKTKLIAPIDLIDAHNSGAASTSTWSSFTPRYSVNKHEKFILFRLKGRVAGIASQANYTKNITFTTPTVIMNTIFKYRVRLVQHVPHPTKQIANYGIAASAAPAIIVPDGDAVGVVADAS